MRNKGQTKYVYQPEVGVKNDFERILQRFSAENTVRYEKFAELWREMKLSLYCAGRQTDRESREFVEICLRVAVQFWLPPLSFLVRAGALYLLYGLYYFQLAVPPVKVRVTPEEWQQIKEFQDDAREQQHLDLDFIFQKMLMDKAFAFVALSEDLYPYFKEVEEEKAIPENLKEETDVVEDIFSSSSLNQLGMLHDQYQKMKIALNGEDATQPDSSLNIVHADMISGIYKTLRGHKEKTQSGVTTQKFQESEDEVMDSFSGLDSVQSPDSVSIKKHLKRKAFERSAAFYKDLPKKKGRPRKIKEAVEGRSDSEVVKVTGTRGRHAISRLYEKDDIESILGDETAEISEAYSMPDVESMVPNLPEDTEPTTEEDENPSKKEHKGKAPLKGKLVKKGCQKVEKDETSESLEEDVEERTVRKQESRTKRKSTEGSVKEDLTISKETSTKKKATVANRLVSNDSNEGNSDGKKVMTAQEKLTQKLNQRKKEARLSKKKK